MFHDRSSAINKVDDTGEKFTTKLPNVTTKELYNRKFDEAAPNAPNIVTIDLILNGGWIENHTLDDMATLEPILKDEVCVKLNDLK